MKRVLSVCTANRNRARGQMVERILRHPGGSRFEAHGGETGPKDVALLTAKVMRDIGIHVSGQPPKSADEFAGQEFQYVITVCDSARQTCPAFPGRGKRLHWTIPDPVQAEGRDVAAIDAFHAVPALQEEAAEKVATVVFGG